MFCVGSGGKIAKGPESSEGRRGGDKLKVRMEKGRGERVKETEKGGEGGGGGWELLIRGPPLHRNARLVVDIQ